jgi:hypothetical protein
MVKDECENITPHTLGCCALGVQSDRDGSRSDLTNRKRASEIALSVDNANDAGITAEGHFSVMVTERDPLRHILIVSEYQPGQ